MTQNNNKQITAGTILSYLSIFISCISAIFTTPFIVRCLGDSTYGVYRIIVSLISYMSILNFGFGSAAVRYLAEFRIKHQSKRQAQFLTMIRWMNFLAVCICIFVGIAVYNLLDRVFSASMTVEEINLAKELFVILIFGVVISILNDIYSSVINAYEQFVFMKSLDVLRNVIKVGLIFAILSYRQSAVYLTMIDLALNIFVLLCNLCFVRKRLAIRIDFRLPKREEINDKFYKEVFVYSLMVLLNSVINQLIWNTDSIIIGMRLNPVKASVYGVGSTISSMFYNMSLVIGNLLVPKTVQLVKSGASKEALTDYMIRVSKIQGYIVLFLVSAYFVLGRQFMELWMGSGYREAWISSLLVMIGSVFASLLVTGHAILKALNRQVFFMGTYFIIFLLNAIITYAVVPQTGIVGAAAVTLATFAFGSVCILIPYYQKCIGLNMKRFVGSLCKRFIPITVIIAIIMWRGFDIIKQWTWIKFIIFAGIYTVVYYCIIYLFVADREEKEKLQNMMKCIGGRKN